MLDTDIAYCAGLIDGEGYIGIKKSKAYKCQGRRTPGYHARIQVRMVDRRGPEFLAKTLGGKVNPEKKQKGKHRGMFAWTVSDLKAETALKAIRPSLKIKGEQADTVLAFRSLKKQATKYRTKVVGEKNFPNRFGTVRMVEVRCLSDDFVGRCEDFYLAAKKLNRVGKAATV